MIDCPEKLHTGAELVVSLSFYLKPTAFQSPKIASEEHQRSAFDESLETAEEQMLRERKSSLIRLFKKLGLKPRRTASLVGNIQDRQAIKNALQNRPKDLASFSKKIKTEVVGDGEEVEVEAGEDLSENELDLIYKKYTFKWRKCAADPYSMTQGSAK